jgi:hypothetical protein
LIRRVPGISFTASTRIDEAGTHTPGLKKGSRGPGDHRPAQTKEIVSGILALAARKGERISLAMIHSTVHAMKPHEPILSGLRFSLTGDVCYSRDIDQAINSLIDSGFLKIDGRFAVVTGRASQFWRYMAGILTNSRIQVIHSVSLRFHDRLRRDARNP